MNGWAGADAAFFQPGYLDVQQRAAFFQIAYSSSPAMVADMINQGSKYPSTARDKDGELLDGSNSYRLHLPAPIPAALYWAVTIYNPEDGTLPQTAQPFPSRNQFDKPLTNENGSLDSILVPTSPATSPTRTGFRPLRGGLFWSPSGSMALKRRFTIRPGNRTTW